MESDSGYQTGDEWQLELFHEIDEGPVFYSDSESGYSDTENQPPQFQQINLFDEIDEIFGPIDHRLEAEQANPANGVNFANENMQLNNENNYAQYENYGFVPDEYTEQNETLNVNFENEQHVIINEYLHQRELENRIVELEGIIQQDDIFPMELEGARIRGVRDEAYLIELEEILGIQRLQIRVEEDSSREHSNMNSTENANRSTNVSKEAETRDKDRINEELKRSRLEIERYENERNTMIEERETIERKAEKLFTALRIEMQEKDIARSAERQARTEFCIKSQELDYEKGLTQAKEEIIKTWEKLNQDKEVDIRKLREENKELRKEIAQLRMTLFETRNHNRL